MTFTHFFLRNRHFSLVAFLFLLALGVQALRTIPMSEDPALDIPSFRVLTVVPGFDAADMEKLVVRPLEDSLKELDDVKKITVNIRDGVSLLAVHFDFSTVPDKKYDEVLRQINALRPKLPPTLAHLEVLRGQTKSVAILQAALISADATYPQLQNAADELRRRIETVPGVSKTATHAAPPREVRVTLNTEHLAQKQISVQDLVTAIQSSNTAIPGGSVEVGDRRFELKAGGAFTSLDELRDVSLRPDTKLRNVADITWADSEKTVFGRYNGERAIFITVMMQQSQNIFTLREGIEKQLKASSLPANMRLEVGFDQSENVGHRMSRLQHDFLIALLLVLVTLAPLGFRSSLIVMISIPLCLALGLAALQWFGLGLNQLSIVGCVIALGLLVDDSIVVVENIARFRREGHPPIEAARMATRQIFVAVVGTTATLLFAFLPLLMLPEAAGQFIRSLPAAVVFAVLASLFVALSIVPWLASALLTGKENPEGNALLRGFHHAIAALYRPLLRWCMAHRATALVVAALLSIGCFALVPSIGFSLFPKADTPQFLVQITAAEGASVAATDDIAKKVEAILHAHPEVRSMFTTVGQGNAQVYYNVPPGDRKANTSVIFVSLHAFDAKTTPALIETMRRETSAIAGGQIVFKEFENGPPIPSPIEVRIIGPDLNKLASLAEQVTALTASTPGTRAVDNPVRVRRTDLDAHLDPDKLAALGITKASAQQAVRLAFAGLESGKFRDADGNEHPIRVCLPQPERATLEAWDRTYVPTATGQPVPLASIATLQFTSAPALIEHKNRERLVTIGSQVQPGFNVDRVTQAIRDRMEKLTLPEGYRYEFGGEVESREESFAGFGNAILIAVFGILAILVIEFKTFRSTLVVASVIPLGIIGGLVGLWLTGWSLSFMAMIGFIALIGIEIKNSILLVDCTNQLRAKGMPLDEAIAQAGEIRFLPVVLTTLTAIGALLPLALEGSALYSPLAIVVMGGSLSSLLLSRVVTPVLYRVFPPQTEA